MGRITKEMKPVHDMLEANGYSQLRSKGSHFIYGNGHNQITITKKPNKMIKISDFFINCLLQYHYIINTKS